MEKKIKKQLHILLFTVVGMFGFGFALIPLYDVFCDITGLNGKDYSRQDSPPTLNQKSDKNRVVKVEFVTYLSKELPWQFKPEVRSISIKPGEQYQISFIAKNESNQNTYGRAVPSISPGYGAQYLVKTECFCFQEQELTANQETNMPLIFYIDPNIPDDISTLTLAYTLFKNEPDTANVAMR